MNPGERTYKGFLAMQQQEFRKLHKLSDSDLQAAVETILRAMPLNLVVKITDLEDEIDAIRTQPDMWRLSAKRGWIFLGDSWQASNAAVILPRRIGAISH